MKTSTTKLNRQFSALVATCLLASLIMAGPSSAKATTVTHGLPSPETYSVDFSNGANAGTGLRFTNIASGFFVDMRLKDFAGKDATRNGRDAKFDPAPGVDVIYDPSGDKVEETIILGRRDISSFKFALTAPGLSWKQAGNRIEIAAPNQSWMFRLEAPIATDSVGRSIPATITTDGDAVFLKLDKVALSRAALPVSIDPTITGVPTGATEGPYRRKLFQMSNGSLVFFDRETLAGTPKIVYRTSSDAGDTWSDPVPIADPGPSDDISAVKTSDDSFRITYSNGTQTLPKISYRTLTKTSTSWTIGDEQLVSTLGVWWRPRPTLVDMGQGTLGEKLAIGFGTFNKVQNRPEYTVAFSEDSGITWLKTAACAIDNNTGTLAVQGTRLVCITVPVARILHSAIWNGSSFANSYDLVRDVDFEDDLPSTVVTDDGWLHMATNGWGKVYYAALGPTATTWSRNKYLGVGTYPAISTTGKSLFIHAQVQSSTKESQIVSYVATDGINFNQGAPIGGHNFRYVIDENKAWQFRDEPGDATGALLDTAGHLLGDVTGTVTGLHRLDSPTKKAALGFASPSSASVTNIKLWVDAKQAGSSGTYRIGIQDSTPPTVTGDRAPTGVWLPARTQAGLPTQSFTTFSFADAVSVNTTQAELDVDAPTPKVVTPQVPETSLEQGHTYFVVVEPVIDCQACSTLAYWADNYIEVQSSGVRSGAEGTWSTHDGDAAVWGARVAEDIPRMTLSSQTGTVVADQSIAASYRYPILESQSPGEYLLARESFTATSVSFFLKKEGTPIGNLTWEVLDQSTNSLGHGSFTPTNGWNNISIDPLTIAANQRYRILLGSTSRD
ncbi:MAG: hypothetical protein ABR507_06120, partial [Actinomycetota bacterium]